MYDDPIKKIFAAPNLKGLMPDYSALNAQILKPVIPDLPYPLSGEKPIIGVSPVLDSFRLFPQQALGVDSSLDLISAQIRQLNASLINFESLSLDWPHSSLTMWINAFRELSELPISTGLKLVTSLEVTRIIDSLAEGRQVTLEDYEFLDIQSDDQDGVVVAVDAEEMFEQRAKYAAVSRRRLERELRSFVETVLVDVLEWWKLYCPTQAKDRLQSMGIDLASIDSTELLESLTFDELVGLISSKKLYPQYFEPQLGPKAEFQIMGEYVRDGRNIEGHSNNLEDWVFEKFTFAVLWFSKKLNFESPLSFAVTFAHE